MKQAVATVLLCAACAPSLSLGMQPGDAAGAPTAPPAGEVRLDAVVESARMTPERLYNGFGRDLPVLVQAPEGAGDLTVELFRTGQSEPVESAPVTPGRVNLASLLPSIWKSASPTLTYVQLLSGGKRVGAPVVLQPMVTPQSASLDPQTGRPRFANVPPTFSGVRAYVDQFVVLETSEGQITLALRPDVAPNTAWNFRQLVAGGFYTDIIFHRVVPALPDGSAFVIQAGDPTGTGTGGPGYMIDLELSSLPHDFGVISMARSGDPNSGGSQFFLCLSREGTARLDRDYTTFGQTVAGADVIAKIAATPLQAGPSNRPVDPPVIRRAVLVDAPPLGTGREPVAKPTPAPQPR